MVKHNPFQSRATFEVDGKTYHYYDLKALENAGVGNVSQLPYSVKVLLESVLRQVDGRVITEEHVTNLRNGERKMCKISMFHLNHLV